MWEYDLVNGINDQDLLTNLTNETIPRSHIISVITKDNFTLLRKTSGVKVKSIAVHVPCYMEHIE